MQVLRHVAFGAAGGVERAERTFERPVDRGELVVGQQRLPGVVDLAAASSSFGCCVSTSTATPPTSRDEQGEEDPPGAARSMARSRYRRARFSFR